MNTGNEITGTVLIVEDDSLILETTTFFLKKRGLEVIGIGSAADITDDVLKTVVDAVLTDINLPGMSGIELIGRVHDTDPLIPVILMTAYADMETAISALKRGAFDFIVKPFDIDYLYHSLQKALKYSNYSRMEKAYKKKIEDMNLQLTKEVEERKKIAEERESLISELQNALSAIKTLHGILPICSACKKIRDDEGYWNQIETYISKHTEADFSHGICPDCAKKLYPKYFHEIYGDNEP